MKLLRANHSIYILQNPNNVYDQYLIVKLVGMQIHRIVFDEFLNTKHTLYMLQ